MTGKPNAELTKLEKPPSRWLMRYRAVKRMVMWHGFSKRLPLFLVTEFPKSGGTWFSQMLADSLEIPFARNHNPPKFEKCLMHGVFLNSSNFHNVTVMMRDGRDIMVSSYYHFLFYNNANLPYGVDKKRNLLQFDDYDDIKTNLPAFIEYMFNEFSRSYSYRCTWSSFVNSWSDKPELFVKYEDVLNDGANVLAATVERLSGEKPDPERMAQIISAYSFENLTGRKRGQIEKGNFIRKGIAGDWKNHFNEESRRIFSKYAGEQLVRLGYEKNHDWVNTPTAADAQ